MTLPMAGLLLAAVLIAIWGVCGLLDILDDTKVGADEPGRVLPGLGADTFPHEWASTRPYDWQKDGVA